MNNPFTKMKTHKFYDSLYRANVEFLIGGSEEELAKRYDKGSSFLKQQGMAGKTFTVSQNGTAVLVGVWLRDKNDIASLVHECVHLANQIFKTCGIKLDIDNDEHLAYYVTYWFEKFRDVL